MIDFSSLKTALDRLASEDIFVGTSSWKYPGWIGQLYQPERYKFRGKFSKSRFQDSCLEEYADIFDLEAKRDVIVNSTFGPIKFYRKNTVVLGDH